MIDMLFRTLYNRDGEHYYTQSGDKIVPIYGYVKDKDSGEDVLKVISKKDQYAEIQSFKDSIDLNLLLARFTNGDLGALNRCDAFYGDVSDLPSDYRTMLDVANDVQKAFDALDPADKAKFGDADIWLKSLMNQTDTSGRQEDVPEPASADIDASKKGVENSSDN